MYAHVTSFRIKPGSSEQARERFERDLVPWLKGQEGFHGFHLTHVSDTEWVVFGVWGSSGDANRARAELDRRVQTAVGDLLTAPPQVKEGEVELHAAGHAPHAQPGA